MVLYKSGEIRLSLETYGRALKLAKEYEKNDILSAVQKILTKVDTNVIEMLLEHRDSGIPREMLLYRLGLNLANKGEYDKAMETFALFLEQYPHHPNAQNVLELMELIKNYDFQGEVVGCLLPLSGRFAIFGQRALKGVALAVKDLSIIFNRDIRVIIKDTRSDDRIAIQGVRELARENAAGIVGPYITAESAGKEAQILNIPLIALSQKEDVARGGNYLFSNFLTPEMQTRALATYAFSKLGITNFFILYPEDRYGIRYMNLFQNVVEELGGKIRIVESYSPDQTDFSDEIKKIGTICNPIQEPSINDQLKRDGLVLSNALFIPDAPAKVSLILPQIVYHSVSNVYLLGTNLWHDKALLKDAAGYIRNSVVTEGFFSDSTRPNTINFVKSFHDIYKKMPRFIEAAAYDSVTVLVRTALEPEVNSRKALCDALGSRIVHEGVTGRFMFDKAGNVHRELFYLTVKKGKFVEISH